ncbi:hypothetical protein AZOA_45490 [Azoarcus sp. Aa7]|nr:hypothetical protein [Azoarcus sp. Aa7]
MNKAIAFVLSAAVMAGCATTPYTTKSMGVGMGMTKAEVVSVMGPPKRASARKTPDGLVERLSWWSPVLIGFTPIDNEMMASDRVFVGFLNGKVVEWGDKYDPSDTMEKTREMQAEMMKNLSKPK